MTESIIKCDTCNRIKGESNNWLVWDSDDTEFQFGVSISGCTDYSKNKDSCSQECLQKEISKFLDRLGKEKK